MKNIQVTPKIAPYLTVQELIYFIGVLCPIREYFTSTVAVGISVRGKEP